MTPYVVRWVGRDETFEGEYLRDKREAKRVLREADKMFPDHKHEIVHVAKNGKRTVIE